MSYWAKSTNEDLSRYLNKIESVVYEKLSASARWVIWLEVLQMQYIMEARTAGMLNKI